VGAEHPRTPYFRASRMKVDIVKVVNSGQRTLITGY